MKELDKELKVSELNEVVENQSSELSIAYNELKISEAEVRKLNEELERKVIKRTAQYAFISQVNQAIVHVNDERTLFQNSCKIAIDFGKFNSALIGLYDSVGNGISILEYSGINAEELSKLTELLNSKKGPQEIVLQSAKYFFCNNIKKTPSFNLWTTFAKKHAICSCIILPIKKAGKIYGTFNLFSTEQNFFDEESIKLAVEVAGDISFALDFYEKAEKFKEIEAKVLSNEKRFRILIENSTDMIILATKEGIIKYGSPSITKMFGYTIEEILNKSTFDFIHPEDILNINESRLMMLETFSKSYQIQLRLKHKNGNWIWCEASFNDMLNEPGIEAMVLNFRDISDKKAKEHQLEFDTNNLFALINTTNDLMWSVDRNFNLITSNLPFDNAGKINHGRIIAKGENVLTTSYNTQMESKFKHLYERAFAGESFTVIEHFYFPLEVWKQISFYPIKKGDVIIGTACNSHNITEVKFTEHQLSISEAFNRGVLDSLNLHIAVIDTTGMIIAVNDSWNNYAIDNGDPKLSSTSVGINYFDICEVAASKGDKIAKEVLIGMKSILEKNELSFYLEYPCHAPTKQAWYGMRAMKFENDIPMIVVSHIDITERKLTEENLILSEARLKEAQALTHISNWEIDLITNVNTWSDEFYNICGLDKNETLPSLDAFLSMIHPDDFDFAKAYIENTFQTFEVGSFNVRIKKNNGEVRYIYSEWKFEFDNIHKAIRIYGIIQDITDRKIAEEEREKLINETIQRNQDLEQFTFIISHNLRAPTANIIGFAEILQDNTLTPTEQNEFLKALSTSVAGLDTVIKDINTILQVKKELNEKKEVISFTNLVNEIINSNSHLINNLQVEIKLDFTEVDELFSLKVYLYSIFYNLISNSIKYRRPDINPIIKISSRLENDKIILSFKDNGLGFDLKTKGDKIFGLYKRFHSHVEGKGMGLFMVKTQVETIGGKITVASEINKGTEFTIEFEK